jgi:hypothetical protein
MGLSKGSLIPLPVRNLHLDGDCDIQQQRKVSAPLLRCSPWRMYSCGDHLATGRWSNNSRWGSRGMYGRIEEITPMPNFPVRYIEEGVLFGMAG